MIKIQKTGLDILLQKRTVEQYMAELLSAHADCCPSKVGLEDDPDCYEKTIDCDNCWLRAITKTYVVEYKF